MALRVYLDGTDLERDSEALMRFRLTYEGPLLSSQPTHKTTEGGLERDRRAEHKHFIRRQFHRQLKEQWQTNEFLRAIKYPPKSSEPILPEAALSVQWSSDPTKPWHLNKILSEVYAHHKDAGYNYVPLVWEEMSLACSLRILCLRKDHANAVLPGRDIDNRIKTLIDALSMPSLRQGAPIKDGKPLPPDDDEKPFYVLMDDDRRVTHLEVETDAALAAAPKGSDESYVRLVITVDIRPTKFHMDNISFA